MERRFGDIGKDSVKAASTLASVKKKHKKTFNKLKQSITFAWILLHFSKILNIERR